ncbi:hypothetical protein HMPREF0216_02722 [Clostridium celatum DSM 1785]|uniref:Uncharacterized protein n=1 Tax=Clostridium celatum DSM 1785 TaxID=545697 RepID=L1Q9Z0_9CLOT|nr:hypothetical protein HMPREF0216_02722 [Clostridium celatum DSM 1785]
MKRIICKSIINKFKYELVQIVKNKERIINTITLSLFFFLTISNINILLTKESYELDSLCILTVY